MLKKLFILLVLFCSVYATGQENMYAIQNLTINNNYSNFGTTFYGDDQVVYASPRKKSFIIRNVWEENNQPFLDLYMGEIAIDGQLNHVKPFSSKINSRYHEGDVAFSKDKKTVYFSRNNFYKGKVYKNDKGISLIHLYRAKINDKGEWVDIEPMPFNNNNYQTGHPTLSADGKTLYFISDMPGGFGGTDIYKATINEDGSVGKAVNLGPEINSPGREMFPSISGNDELYFSSDGRGDGLGELDIYASKIYTNSITKPRNLGAPINSNKDDFSFIINYETRRGYFSSNREGGKGDDDIYTFIQNIPIDFNCYQNAKVTVTDKKTGKLLPGSNVILYNSNGEILKKEIVGENGTVSFRVDCNKSYKVEGGKEGYTVDSKEFYTTENEDLDVPLVLALDEFRFAQGKCIVNINPIYFDFDKSDIRDDAKIELNKVVDVMKKYPEIIIEGGSHTDSRGSGIYNMKLSEERAKATFNYIISQGISPNRISARGYGETQLVNKCADGVNCTDEQHQVNRRTEFVIVNRDSVQKKYPEVCTVNSITTKQQFNIPEFNKDSISTSIVLPKEFINKGEQLFINLEPIIFDLNSSYINKNTKKALNKVVFLMLKYPTIKVECGSHTDSRASEKYNNWISERRANRCVDYMVSRGIDVSRVVPKGYGESQLINNCTEVVKCTEIEYAKNRRTEFKILNPESVQH